MFGIGPQELLVILIVGLLVLGPKRLPESARSLGKGLAEFRRASSDLRQSLALEDEPKRHAPPATPPAQAAHAELPATEAAHAELPATETEDPAEGHSIAPSEDTATDEPARTGAASSPDTEK